MTTEEIIKIAKRELDACNTLIENNEDYWFKGYKLKPNVGRDFWGYFLHLLEDE